MSSRSFVRWKVTWIALKRFFFRSFSSPLPFGAASHFSCRTYITSTLLACGECVLVYCWHTVRQGNNSMNKMRHGTAGGGRLQQNTKRQTKRHAAVFVITHSPVKKHIVTGRKYTKLACAFCKRWALSVCECRASLPFHFIPLHVLSVCIMYAVCVDINGIKLTIWICSGKKSLLSTTPAHKY